MKQRGEKFVQIKTKDGRENMESEGMGGERGDNGNILNQCR